MLTILITKEYSFKLGQATTTDFSFELRTIKCLSKFPVNDSYHVIKEKRRDIWGKRPVEYIVISSYNGEFRIFGVSFF